MSDPPTKAQTRRGNSPDMTFMRNDVPIQEVAAALGIQLAGRSAAHCWRTEKHQNGDRTPSVSFYKNRARCFVCDPGPLSTLDLVMAYQQTTLMQAARWMCARWEIPMIAKYAKLVRSERWKTSPVGLSNMQLLENLVRSGYWAFRGDAARAILTTLLTFAENDKVTISYKGIRRYSGKGSDTTVSQVLQNLEQDGLLRAETNVSTRETGTYIITPDNAKFQNLLSSLHETLMRERDQERQLRRERKRRTTVPVPEGRSLETSPSNTPPIPAALPKSNPVSTTVEKQPTAHSTAVERALEPSSTAVERAVAQENQDQQVPRRKRTPEELAAHIAQDPVVQALVSKFGNLRIVDVVDLQNGDTYMGSDINSATGTPGLKSF